MQSNYSKSSKSIYCRKGCNNQITFDYSIVSESGKLVPLNLDGTKHECPADPYNSKHRNQSTTMPYNPVYPNENNLHLTKKYRSGIPRIEDNVIRISASEEDLINIVQSFIAEINKRLTTTRIRILVQETSNENNGGTHDEEN